MLYIFHRNFFGVNQCLAGIAQSDKVNLYSIAAFIQNAAF